MPAQRLVLRLLALLCVLGALPAAGARSAAASPGMLVGIADDGVTQRDPSLIGATVPSWRAAGVDVARVQVGWEYVAPEPHRMSPPSGFDARDPAAQGYRWAAVDQTINALRSAGIEPVISITGPGPLWASRVPALRNPRYKPDPRRFAAFATAVARRYGFAAKQYAIWNEPNLPLWLQPQFDCAGRHCTPASPALYRALFRSGASAVRHADPGARVYAGALAPRGSRSRSRNANMPPLMFLRSLGCVDRRLHRERRTTHCRHGFHPIDADGIAYHPHGILRPPEATSPHRDDAALGDTRRLLRTIDGIQRARGLRRSGSFHRRFSLYFTEWGYQTDRPDPILGVPLRTQSIWLQRGTYLAWRQPRVRMLIQYLWRDDPVRANASGPARYAGWQSGLNFADGSAKPARATFLHPFWATLRKGSRVATLWGQVRPGGATVVSLQRRTAGRRAFTTFLRRRTTSRGYFRVRARTRHTTTYRFRYEGHDADGRPHTFTSSAVRVSPR